MLWYMRPATSASTLRVARKKIATRPSNSRYSTPAAASSEMPARRSPARRLSATEHDARQQRDQHDDQHGEHRRQRVGDAHRQARRVDPAAVREADRRRQVEVAGRGSSGYSSSGP